MEILPVCGILAAAIALSFALKQTRPEFARLVAIGAAVFCALYALKSMEGVIGFFRDLAGETGYGSYFTILFKSLGIGLLTGALAEVCRDLGEGTLARGAELAGKGAILALAFPILEGFLELIRRALEGAA